MSSFEDQLWSQLVREHGARIRAAPQAAAALAASAAGRGPRAAGAARGYRPRHAALMTATALVIAGVVIALVLALGASSTPPAFAVTRNPDGTVTVRLNHLSAISALNARLVRYGLHARLANDGSAKTLPLSAKCRVPGGGSQKPWRVQPFPGGSQSPTRACWLRARTPPPKSG